MAGGCTWRVHEISCRWGETRSALPHSTSISGCKEEQNISAELNILFSTCSCRYGGNFLHGLSS